MSTENHPVFHSKDITVGSTFILSTGAKLTVCRNPFGVFIRGTYGEVQSTIALSEEAAEILIACLVSSRPNKRAPLPCAILLPVDISKPKPEEPARIESQ